MKTQRIIEEIRRQKIPYKELSARSGVPVPTIQYTNEEVDINYDGRIDMTKYIDEFFSTTKKTAFEELI